MSFIDQYFWLGVAARSHDRDDDDDNVESRHVSGWYDSDATSEPDLVGEVAVKLSPTLNFTVSKFIKFIP